MGETERSPQVGKFDIQQAKQRLKEHVIATQQKALPIWEKFEEKLIWDKIRKPRLLKEFKADGLSSPEKAVEVVSYLESNIYHTNYKKVSTEKFTSKKIPYRYRSDHLEMIKQFTEGIDDPVKALEQLSQLIVYNDPYRLDYFASYFSELKKYPKFTNLLDRLTKVKAVEKISLNNISYTPEGKSYYSMGYPYYINSADSLKSLLGLPEEEYNDLVTEENLTRLQNLDTELNRKDGPSFDLTSLPDLLKISNDPQLVSIYSAMLKHNQNFYGTDWGELVRYSAYNLVQIKTQVPELIDLATNGFYIETEVKAPNMVGRVKTIDAQGITALKNETAAVVQDSQLLQNAKILANYGLAASLQPHGYESSDFYRTADSATLEKALVIWSNYKLGENSEKLTKWGELHSIFQTLSRGCLAELNVSDVKDAFDILNQQSISYDSLPCSLSSLVQSCKNGQELKTHIDAAIRPEIQEAFKDKDFLNLISSYTHEDIAITHGLACPEDILFLYQHKEALSKRLERLRQSYISLDNSDLNQTYKIERELLELSDGLFLKLQEFLKNANVRTLNEQILERVQMILNSRKFDEELKQQLLDHLAYFGMADILNTYQINNEAWKILATEKGKKGADIIAVIKEFTEKYNFQSSYDRSEEILFINYLLENPQAMSSLKQFMMFYENEQHPVYRVQQVISSRNISSFEKLVLRNLQNKKFDITQFIDASGSVTAKFLEQLAQWGETGTIEQLLSERTLSLFTTTDKDFWQYWKNTSSSELKNFLINNRERFPEFLVDGKETKAFYLALIEENADYFTKVANREQWKLVFGENLINQLLNILPKLTDEKRNAFTHNEYDRTSQFLQYLVQNAAEDFKLTQQDIEVLIPYIEQFGLSKTPLIFHYFKYLHLHQLDSNIPLPEDIKSSGITSIEQLKQKLLNIKKLVYSQKPLIDLSSFDAFDIQVIKLVTGKSTHSFDSGRAAIETIIGDFQSDIEGGKIAPLPPEYISQNIETSEVKIEFNAEGIREDYNILQYQILDSIDQPEEIQSLKNDLQEMIQRKIAEIDETLRDAEGKKKEFIQKEKERFSQYHNKLEGISDLDSLLSELLDMNFNKTERKNIDSVLRLIIFRKVFQKHFSPEMINNLRNNLLGEISPQSILSIVNVIDHMAKAHVLSLETDNQEGYWKEETFEKMKQSKKGRSLPEIFSPHVGKLRQEVENFQMIQTGQSEVVEIIPDRGFIGEMSGYLANVCYTKEYPLLKRFPNLIPYKFIKRDSATQTPEFIGSVLVFETADQEGNPCLLVRAFDVPQESKINIITFFEQFLNRLTEVAKQKGKKKILVAGTTGTISNYQLTTNHVLGTYVQGKQPTPLQTNFDFNGYDITRNCYLAREIS